ERLGAGPQLAADDARLVDEHHHRGLEARVQPNDLFGRDHEPGLLERLADRALRRRLVHLEEAAGLCPEPASRLEAAPDQHDLAGLRYRDGRGHEARVHVGDVAAARAGEAVALLARDRAEDEPAAAV